MPLFKGCGCKGKPAKAIDYITDEKKAAIVTSHALDDTRDYARQFAETAKLFGKAQKYNSRKYYHFKHSFDPKDNITPEEAHRLTEELAQEAFPDNEYIIATHTDKDHIHCHIIVNSVSFVNGKMLHYSKDEYGRLKDRSNEIAAKYGYSTLDFRKPSADRIKSEERQIVLKGGTSWKEELREVIAEAKRLCNDMESFEKHLNKYGVTITRNTAKTISYLHPQKKKPSLVSIVLPKRMTKLTNNAFARCYSLKDIKIPNSICAIEMMAFQDCSSLKTIDLPTELSKIGGNAFQRSGLKSISIPQNVTEIQCWTFESCESLKTVQLSESITNIFDGAFQNCYSLERIDIYEKCAYIAENAFEGCNKLTIYGIKGSYAEKYAKEHSIPFVAL